MFLARGFFCHAIKKTPQSLRLAAFFSMRSARGNHDLKTQICHPMLR
jgi:hypothetical protein